MKFIADRMLGRLTRWLRRLGYDTIEIKKQENEDDLLMALAQRENRTLISRDQALIRRALKKGIMAYLVKSSEIMEQLQELEEEFNIKFDIKMDRCSLCNTRIRKVKPDEIELVSEKEYVYQTTIDKGTEFWICDNCGQVYWQGKHWENIKEKVETLLGKVWENPYKY